LWEPLEGNIFLAAVVTAKINNKCTAWAWEPFNEAPLLFLKLVRLFCFMTNLAVLLQASLLGIGIVPSPRL